MCVLLLWASLCVAGIVTRWDHDGSSRLVVLIASEPSGEHVGNGGKEMLRHLSMR